MNKRLLAIAIAAGLASPFAAHAGASLFGVAHISLNQVDVGTTDGELDFTNNKSHVGIKGSEDMGDGMSAIYMASWQVDYMDNSSTGPDTDLLVYDRWLGLKGGFGTVKFGTMASNYKQTAKIVDPFWSTRAEQRGISGVAAPALLNGIGVDRSRLTNAVQYMSNNMNGLTFVANVTMDGDASGDNNIGLGARYKGKNFQVFFDYLSLDVVPTTPPPTINAGETAMKIGGSYTMGGTTVALAVENTEDLLGADYNQFSVTHKLTEKGTLALSYGTASPTAANTDKSTYVLGYKHKMSKQTSSYAAYMDSSNDVASTEVSGFSFGLVHKF